MYNLFMDKALLTAQLNIVKNLPSGGSHDFTLEGAAVLKAFVATRSKMNTISDAEKALHKKISMALHAWENGAPTKNGQQKPATEKKPNQQIERTQLALREAIDKAQQGRMEEISADEVKLLRGAHDAYSRRVANGAVSDTRLRDLLNSVLKQIDAHRGETGDGSSMFASDAVAEGISTDDVIKNAVIAEEAFGDIQRSPLSKLEEIDVDLNVRVFEYEGNTSVEGDIPQDVLVRVSEGRIAINGFVTGAVVASGDIHVSGNVQQGTLISNEGDITAERVLLGSSIVAKKGSATCLHLEAPTRAFAWNTFSVEGPVLRGKLCAGSIEVKEKTVGAELHSCGKIVAKSMQTGPKGPTVVCLRNSLTCEDYGRSMDSMNSQRQQDVKDLNDKIRTAEEMDRLTHHLIQNCYRTCLFYLLGGIENASTAMSLQGLQIKTINMRQIISLAEAAIKFYQAAYDDAEQCSMEKAMAFNKESMDNLGVIRKDIEVLPEEFGSAHKRFLLDRCNEFASMMKQQLKQFENSDKTDYLQTTFVKTASGWRGILGDTDREIREIIALFGLEDEVLNRINNEPDALEDMVTETVDAKLKSAEQREVQRAKSPVIRLLQKSAERYARNIETNHRRVVEARASLKELRKELTEQAAILFGDSTPGACLVKSSSYDAETIITASPNDRSGKEANMGKVIVLEQEIKEPTEFWLRDQLIQKIV